MHTHAPRENKPAQNTNSAGKKPANIPAGRHSYTTPSPAAEPLWARRMVQPALTVGASNDPYEQEADRVADHIMRMPMPGVQRKCTKCEEEEKKRPTIRRWMSDPVGNNMSVPDNFVSNLGSGQPLDRGTRSFFEPRFGSDFGNVRVHTGPSAAESARSIGARAYTLGNNVVFGAGEYQPGTIQGKRLMAHELTHVVQQNFASTPPRIVQMFAAPPTSRPVNVYAAQRDSGHILCPDARLRGNNGQAGWDIGINFTTLSDLNSQIADKTQWIGRLAIVAHGLAGEIQIEGVGQPPLTAYRLRAALDGLTEIDTSHEGIGNYGNPLHAPEYNLEHYRQLVSQLYRLGCNLDSRASVMFSGCLAGQGPEGSRLLRLLSGPELFNREVIAFSTVASIMGDQMRAGGECSEPGSRITNDGSPEAQNVHTDYSGQNLPWADESAPHSMVAHTDGTIYETDFQRTIPDEFDAFNWQSHQEPHLVNEEDNQNLNRLASRLRHRRRTRE